VNTDTKLVYNINSFIEGATTHNPLVIIGDGFAAGFGDYITFGSCGGIAQYLKDAMSKELKVIM
jgi:hypothetical protein